MLPQYFGMQFQRRCSRKGRQRHGPSTRHRSNWAVPRVVANIPQTTGLDEAATIKPLQMLQTFTKTQESATQFHTKHVCQKTCCLRGNVIACQATPIAAAPWPNDWAAICCDALAAKLLSRRLGKPCSVLGGVGVPILSKPPSAKFTFLPVWFSPQTFSTARIYG